MAKIITNDGRVHIAEPAHVNSSPKGGLTQALADEWSKASDLISINSGKLQGFDQLVASNCIEMLYTKSCFSAEATLPETMYSHHWNGSSLVRKANTSYAVPYYIMQPDNQAWRDHDKATLLSLKAKNPYIEAVFNDSARATYAIGGHPVVPGTHTDDTPAAWYQKLKGKLDYCNAALGYNYACLNGLTTDTVTAFTPCIGMVEAAFGPLDHSLPSLNDWKALGNLTWDSQTLGWTPWLYVKMGVDHGTAEWNAFRALSLPSALLWDKGSVLYCIGGKEGTPPSWVTGEHLHPWYRPNIGSALDTKANWSDYLDVSGAYVRHFERGAVIVNPTSAGVSVKFADGSSHPVAAQSGTILRQTVTWQQV